MKSIIYSGEQIHSVWTHLKEVRNIVIVYDENTEKYIKEVENFDSDRKIRGCFRLHASEKEKTIDTVMEICRFLLERNTGRDACLMAIGGGITTDIAGFAASIYKRGIDFVLVPTTVLAQTDAAIGGKNGVNLDGYKNMLGVIKQPKFTYLCTEVLASLNFERIAEGGAELLKTFIINNKGNNYEKIVELLKKIYKANYHNNEFLPELSLFIERAAHIKAEIVEKDEYEYGERRKLNLGHTFAHAIEHESGNEISHGQAVATGIILAAKLHSNELAGRLAHDFAECGLNTEMPIDINSLAGAMSKDKKAGNGIIKFIVPHGIGDVRIEELTAEQAIQKLI